MGTTNVNRSFQILTLTLSHPSPNNTSLGVWIWTSAHSHRERGWIQDYLIFTSHHASAVISGWIRWICRCATIGASVVGEELEFELHIVLGLPDHPHEETLREVHGEWFVKTPSSLWTPYWRKKATLPQSDADLADFRHSVRECGGSESLTVFPYPVSPSLPRRGF